jgi:ubiquinone/menaquinone biosynthesis C-methylase UbiE
MSALRFDADMARLQRTLAQCHDLLARRCAVLETLNLRTGERVLEVGCGGGFYAVEAARCVGPTGRVCAIDISADQIAAARERCRDMPWVECTVADIMALPYQGAEFDAVYGNQVLEYVPALDAALEGLRRVLRPGGRLVIAATNWSSVVWHTGHADRMERVLAAWAAHAPFPDLPAALPARLRRAGFQPQRQTPVPMLNMSYNENAASYWLAELMRRFVVARQAISAAEAEAWLEEFADLERQGAYFFCSTPIITEAMKVS